MRIPGSTTNVSLRIGVEQRRRELAAIAGVDQSGRIDDRDAVLGGEPGSRLDEACVPGGDRDGQAGADCCPRARRQLGVLARRQIESRVARVGACRHDRVGVEPLDGESGQASSRGPARLGDHECGEPRQLAPRETSDDHDTFGRVGALLDRRSERVELREPRALRVGHEHPHARPAIVELLGERGHELVETFAGRGGDLRRIGKAVRQAAPPERVDQVDLVQDDVDRQLPRSDLAQHVVDGVALAVLLVVGGGRVDHVQHHVGDQRLFQGRRETLDQLMGQPADEADGVGHEVAAPIGFEPAGRRVERLEEPVLDRDVGAGEGVQERRLADVRVPGEGDRRRLGALPLLAPRRALALDRLQLAARGR